MIDLAVGKRFQDFSSLAKPFFKTQNSRGFAASLQVLVEVCGICR